ncbi:MAG: hypothetical protein IKG93_08130 [Clostridiales bacterium]|nr:hypothetical protein [Clostridiales bacterium]
MTSYSKELVKCIHACLTEENLNYHFDKKKGVFIFGVRHRKGSSKIMFFIHVRANDFFVHGIMKTKVDTKDKKLIQDIALLLLALNAHLVYGYFAMDPESGRILYKTYVDCNGIRPTYDMIRESFCCPILMIMGNISKIKKLIKGKVTIDELLKQLKKEQKKVKTFKSMEDELFSASLEHPGSSPTLGIDFGKRSRKRRKADMQSPSQSENVELALPPDILTKLISEAAEESNYPTERDGLFDSDDIDDLGDTDNKEDK